MVSVEQMADQMLIIHALDSSASVKYSSYTRKWYVEAHIEIGDGTILSGLTEHRSTPEEAVGDYLLLLQSVKVPKYVVTRFHDHRREWRWNGAAFAECTREEAMR